MKKDKFETNNKTINHQRRKRILKCTICPPNKGENAKRKGKHGKTKPRYKNHK